jgi:hypothetical protein
LETFPLLTFVSVSSALKDILNVSQEAKRVLEIDWACGFWKVGSGGRGKIGRKCCRLCDVFWIGDAILSSNHKIA